MRLGLLSLKLGSTVGVVGLSVELNDESTIDPRIDGDNSSGSRLSKANNSIEIFTHEV